MLKNENENQSTKTTITTETSQETILMLDEELEYPKLKNLLDEKQVQEKVFSSVTSTYRPPTEAMMGPITYPPGRLRTDDGTSSSFQGRRPRGLPGGIGRHQNE